MLLYRNLYTYSIGSYAPDEDWQPYARSSSVYVFTDLGSRNIKIKNKKPINSVKQLKVANTHHLTAENSFKTITLKQRLTDRE